MSVIGKKQWHGTLKRKPVDFRGTVILSTILTMLLAVRAFGPVLEFSTYLGGNDWDAGYDLVVDLYSNIFIVGITGSTNMPTTNAYQGSLGGMNDAFLAKFDASGSNLMFFTYLGGSSNDNGRAIDLDAAGNIYLTGQTRSPDFPVCGGVQSEFGGFEDAFIVKFDRTGTNLIYSTYIGGAGGDGAIDITVAASGEACIVGQTSSTNFPTHHPFQDSRKGYADVFVTKLDGTGSNYVFSTYLGGSNTEFGWSADMDSAGNIYVSGITYSSNAFPITAGAFQTNYRGSGDGFIAKLTTSGSTPTYCTYLGGTGSDSPYAITVDAQGYAYIAGRTSSGNYPVTNAFQLIHAGGADVFVTKLGTNGSTLVYSTFLGGSHDDEAQGVAVNTDGEVYLAGETGSTDFPTQIPYQRQNRGLSRDIYIAKLGSTGSNLVYSTFYGGTGGETAYAIALDSSGHAYVTGITDSTNLCMINSYQGSFAGEDDAFIAKFIDPYPGALRFADVGYSVTEYCVHMTATVQRVGGTNGLVSIGYVTSNGTATAGEDYGATNGTLTFSDGDYVDKTFMVAVLDDDIFEGDETVHLSLVNPCNGVFGCKSAVVLTINDCEPGEIQFAYVPVEIFEDGAPVSAMVERVRGCCGTVSVDYATSDGTAIGEVDYVAVSGTLNFANNATSSSFVIAATNDDLSEGLEYAHLILSNPQTGASLGDPRIAALVIWDDDVTSDTLSETFDSGLPAGWTVLTNGTANAYWRFDDPAGRGNNTGGNGAFAIADGDQAGTVNMDTELRTPGLNLSTMATIRITFKTDYQAAFARDSGADIDISMQGAAGPWSNIWKRRADNYSGPQAVDIGLSGIAAGNTNVMIRFHYTNGPDMVYFDGWWQIDDVRIYGEIDVDADGMPDWWELANFGTLTNNAQGDNDQDQFANLREQQLGTHPTNTASVFAIDSILWQRHLVFTFPSWPLRTYTVQWSTNLPDAEWGDLRANFAGIGGLMSVIDTNETADRIYRIEVEIP